MRRLLIAIAMFLGGESSALACSCLARPVDPVKLRALANEIAADATALVEVDVRSGYDVQSRRGERMRVRRTFAGRAPREFRLARGDRPPSSAMCDVDYYVAGSRPIMLIYPADRPRGRGQAQFRDAGLCVSMYLHDAGFRQMLVEAMRRRPARERTSAAPARLPCASRA